MSEPVHNQEHDGLTPPPFHDDADNFTGRMLGTLSASSFARNLYSGLTHVPLLGTLVHAAAGKVFAGKKRVWARIPHGLGKGLWLKIDPRFEYQMLSGDHEREAQELLAAQLKPGDCFYDVGAHTGFFSLAAARLVSDSGRVIAFEADPENAALLRATVAKNNFPQIEVVEAAVWSSSGPVEFERAPSASSLVDGKVGKVASSNINRVQVAGITLDEYISRSGSIPPTFLKIDVELSESEVLDGAAELFRTSRPFVLCEVHTYENRNKVRTWLSARNYRLHNMDGRSTLPMWFVASDEEQ
ncbi:MAG TPA: FkbM family methyltransferase [Candidatus Acidoferrales bacterium]|nr:FkbM family methyltransferase [Candidatus Acidoferrales bacterium]